MEKRKDNTEVVKGQQDNRRFKVQDNEGHMQGDNLSSFNEQSAQERQQDEDNSELNRKDQRDVLGGNEQV